MRFFSTLVLGASALLTFASAQNLPFISWIPGTITVGSTYNVTYKAANMNSPVTIILRKGASTHLDTIGTLTETATGGSYMWTVSRSLANGDDYALEITQGTSAPNYSDRFTISGSTVTAVSTASDASSTASGSSSSASAASTARASGSSAATTVPSTATKSASVTAASGPTATPTGAAAGFKSHLGLVVGVFAAVAYFY